MAGKDPIHNKVPHLGNQADNKAATPASEAGNTCEVNLSETNRKLGFLLDLGTLINLNLQLDDMLIEIARKAKNVMGADRFTILLYDRDTDELWTKVAAGIEGRKVRIPSNNSVAGYCFQTGETVNLTDAHEDPRFFREIDIETGYHTQSLLSMPFYSRSGEPLGVIQLINKKDGVFTAEDETFLRTFNNHAAVFIEMAQLQKAKIEALERSRKELERLTLAKGKALDHLAHEIKTPLALIQAVARLLKKKLVAQNNYQGLESLFDTLERNLGRLFDTQQETDKIIRTYREIIEDRMPREGFPDKGDEREGLNLLPFVAGIVKEVEHKSAHRKVAIRLSGNKSLSVFENPHVVKDVVTALLKNAVENTPDGGFIEISVTGDNRYIRLAIEDHGIGITEENKGHLFDGFFHTQDTNLYRSGKAYDFFAGGKGLDLLMVKLYAQRFGFDVSMESNRCIYIPADRDLCPGNISLCPFCKTPETCYTSGGSTFTLQFPLKAEDTKG